MTARINKTRVGTFAARAFYTLLKQSVDEDTIYAGVHYIPDSDWNAYAGSIDSESTFWGGGDSDFDSTDETYYNQTMYSMHKVFPGGVTRVVPRTDWTYGTIYNSYPGEGSFVLTKGYDSGFATINVYTCLHSPLTASEYAPSGNTGEPFTLSDGYVWKYAYSISNSQAIRFLNSKWMPLPEKLSASEIATITSASSNYNQYLIQTSTDYGAVYGVTLDSDLLSSHALADSDFRVEFEKSGYNLELLGRDVKTNTPTQTFKLNLKYDGNTNKYSTTFVEAGKGYVGPMTMGYDSDSATIPGITPTIAPGKGFGANIPLEMNANNIMISVRNFPDENSKVVYNGSLYNMISLHINPIDVATSKTAQKEFYATSNYFEADGPVGYSVGDFIRPYYNDDGRRGLVISIDGNTIYYITTVYGNQYDFFGDSEVVSLVNGNKVNSVKKMYNREIAFESSDLLVADYKQIEVTRNEGQIESFNFVLSF